MILTIFDLFQLMKKTGLRAYVHANRSLHSPDSEQRRFALRSGWLELDPSEESHRMEDGGLSTYHKITDKGRKVVFLWLVTGGSMAYWEDQNE